MVSGGIASREEQCGEADEAWLTHHSPLAVRPGS